MWIKSGKKQGNFDESGYEIDHIHEFSQTHDNNESNLQALCKTCHGVKTSRFMTKLRADKKKQTNEDNTNNNNIENKEEDHSDSPISEEENNTRENKKKN